MSDPGMTSEQRAAIAVHYATQNRVCLDAGAEGEICIACAEVADQIDAAVEVERQAAEERGRRRGVEEAAEVCAEKARNYALRAAGQRAHGDLEEAQFLEPVATAVRDAEAAIRALAPRDSAPVCWKCGAPYRDDEACGYCQAPRNSGPLSAKDRAHVEDVADRYERGEFHCSCGKPLTAEHQWCGAPRDSGPAPGCLCQGGKTQPYCAYCLGMSAPRDSGNAVKSCWLRDCKLQDGHNGPHDSNPVDRK